MLRTIRYTRVPRPLGLVLVALLMTVPALAVVSGASVVPGARGLVEAAQAAAPTTCAVVERKVDRRRAVVVRQRKALVKARTRGHTQQVRRIRARLVKQRGNLRTAQKRLKQCRKAATKPSRPAADPWIVSLGDSYISGEAGRWAGNSNKASSRIDALGPTAYFDNADGTGEQIPGCHRSSSAEVHIGGGVKSKNFACSGGETSTSVGAKFKPGLDFHQAQGRQGQALMLEEFARDHDVEMVVASIGGNDFGFADIVTTCVLNFLLTSSALPILCKDDKAVIGQITPERVKLVTADIVGSFTNVRQAMRNAGYRDFEWTLLVQNYPSPIPNGGQFRYARSGYDRQAIGGCGFWDADANHANGTLLPAINGAVRDAVEQSGLSNVKRLDLSGAFKGHRLCERSVGLLEEAGLDTWQSEGASDASEWINQIRTVTTVGDSVFTIQESLHPNYWGQLALRNCVRQAWNDGTPRGGTCRSSGIGQNGQGEPVMTLD